MPPSAPARETRWRSREFTPGHGRVTDRRGWIGDEEPLPKPYGERDADLDRAVGEQREVDAAYADLLREGVDGRVGR